MNRSKILASGIFLPEDFEMRIEMELEEDGRWIAEVPELPGVLVYGQTRKEALKKVEALALRVIADRLDHGEMVPALLIGMNR
jgi:predicted RNase H-like HicB family nuclease